MGIETAILGAAAIGAGASYMSSSSASDSADASIAAADAAAQLQYKTSQQQLEFAKQQYNDWQSIFGDTQIHLKNYYNNLSSDTIASLGIQNIEKEYARSSQMLDTALAQRGMSNSGATAAGLTQLEQTRMLGRAEAQTNAPMLAAQQKVSFLSAGMGQLSSTQSSINNAYTQQMNVLGQQYSGNMNQASQYNTLAANAGANVGGSISSGINQYMMYNALNNASTTNAMKSWWQG